MNIQTYTDNEMIKNLALLENHLKQAPFDDTVFCEECINKHLILLEGLAEEGLTAGGDLNKYQKVYDFALNTKNKDYRKEGIELANQTRQIRKSLNGCVTCPEIEIKKATKDLNNTSTFNNYNLNKFNKKNKMVSYTELGIMNAGQFAAEGVRYLAETNATLMPYEKYVTIGGGIGLQALGLFVRLPSMVKQLSLIAGSNLLAGGVIKLVKGTPALRAGAVRLNAGNAVASYAPTFGGPTFSGRVTASNIPTRYVRAGILSGAQAFEAPEHADLIRVD